jgi:hypothetical protein
MPAGLCEMPSSENEASEAISVHADYGEKSKVCTLGLHIHNLDRRPARTSFGRLSRDTVGTGVRPVTWQSHAGYARLPMRPQNILSPSEAIRELLDNHKAPGNKRNACAYDGG